MNLIDENEKALAFLTNKASILDGRLSKIAVYQESILYAELTIDLIHSKKIKQVLLQFIDVKEYYFNYNSQHFFYYIERYKFFKSKELFYISLDPFDESEEIHPEDNDLITAANIRLYATYR